MHSLRILLLAALLGGIAVAQPSISSVENAASNTPQGLPNSGIAQGSMFVVKGAHLGPAAIVIDNTFPLETTLAGTSVRVTSNGQVKDAILYYTLDKQVAAILPSSTPTGTGTLTVTFNGQTSSPVPVVIAGNNVQIYTVNSSGAGPAVATFPNGFLSPTNSAQADDIVIFWTNGLGSVNFAENVAALGGDMTAVPLEVWIGGKPATILYRGRNACCSSVDTVYVRMPAGLSGCAVPVSMKIGNLVSNTATIPVASTGRTCTPIVGGLLPADVERLLAKPTLSVGGLLISRAITTSSVNIGPVPTLPIVSKSDTGAGNFFLYSSPSQVVLSTKADLGALGSCSVVSFSGENPPTQTGLSFTTLDAGTILTVSGPNGNRTVNKNTTGGISYGATLGAGTPGNYLDAGAYTVSALGGTNVGQFTAGIVFPIPLDWKNQSSITTVGRGAGVTVNWTGGGGANSFVQISGTSISSSGGIAVGAAFYCTVKATDGTFAVPPYILQALPASGTSQGSAVPGTLSLNSFNLAPFNAGGLDIATVKAVETVTQSVTYQ